MLELSSLELDHLGLALIVCGAAFVCSGLIFVLPRERNARTFDENLKQVDSHLRQMREDQRDR